VHGPEVTSTQLYDFVYPRRRLRGEPLGAMTRLGVWLVVQKIADPIRKVPPHGAWLWRLRK
jgi:hypothetical protein